MDDGQRGRTVLVTTRLENASLLLTPEMMGNAEIFSGERRSSIS